MNLAPILDFIRKNKTISYSFLGLFVILSFVGLVFKLQKDAKPAIDNENLPPSAEQLGIKSQQSAAKTDFYKPTDIQLEKTNLLPQSNNFTTERINEIKNQLTTVADYFKNPKFEIIASDQNSCQTSIKQIPQNEQRFYDNKSQIKQYRCDFSVKVGDKTINFTTFNTDANTDAVALKVYHNNSGYIFYTSFFGETE